MRTLPNILSSFRIVGAIIILFCDVTSVVFWGLYLTCGISDMADGWLARKFDCATKIGALLDSVADICFVVCCAWKLLLVFELPLWLWIWAGVIVVIKVINQILALVMHGKCSFPHTIANKVTGLLLFIAIPMTFWSIIPLAIVAAIATFAAVQEGHFIRVCQSV